MLRVYAINNKYIFLRNKVNNIVNQSLTTVMLNLVKEDDFIENITFFSFSENNY